MILVACLMLMGCGIEPTERKFQNGDLVTTVLGNQKGMVIYYYDYYIEQYDVRMYKEVDCSVIECNDDETLGFAVIRFKVFELKKYNEWEQ